MFPSGYKASKIYSINPVDGSGDLSFARSSTGTRVNSDGFIETVPLNLLNYSELFSNTSWSKLRSTITPNAATSPIGDLTASELDIGANGYLYKLGVSVFPNTEYTLSFYVQDINSANNTLAIYDESNASFISIDIPYSVTNQWTRVTHTFTTPTGCTSARPYIQRGVGGSGSLYIWGAQLNAGSTAKTYFPTTDRLNYPRIDYLGGGCGKLLIEPQRTNTVLWNSDYTQLWANANVVITQNATISPNGSNDAQKLTSANAFGQHFLRQILGGHTVGSPYVYSCFAKAAELDILSLRLFQGDAPTIDFDLTNGTHDGGANGKMIDYGNGWYRCMTYHSALNQYLYPYIYTQVGNQQGDGVSGLYVYGAMIEEGTVETSLIDTTNAAVTRTQDTSLTTSSNIAAAINGEEGVLFIDFERLGLDFEDSWMGLYNGAVSSNFRLAILYRKDRIIGYVRVAGSWQAVMQYYGTWTMPRIKVALKYKANDFALWVNGVEGVTDTSGSTFGTGVLDTLNLGDHLTSSNPKFNARINAIAVYDTALSDADLTELTTL